MTRIIKDAKPIKFGKQVSVWDMKIMKGEQLKMDLNSKIEKEKKK